MFAEHSRCIHFSHVNELKVNTFTQHSLCIHFSHANELQSEHVHRAFTVHSPYIHFQPYIRRAFTVHSPYIHFQPTFAVHSPCIRRTFTFNLHSLYIHFQPENKQTINLHRTFTFPHKNDLLGEERAWSRINSDTGTDKIQDLRGLIRPDSPWDNRARWGALGRIGAQSDRDPNGQLTLRGALGRAFQIFK